MDPLELLAAIRDQRVVRDDVDGTRIGLWALYTLDGVEVGMQVRNLARRKLVDTFLLGPPKITVEGVRELYRR